MLTNSIVQVAYFVSDARASAREMHCRFGAGPFFVANRIELAWGEHRGQPCDFLHTSAYGQWGDLMMELVQQDEEGPSPFRDLYDPGQEGIHHVATFVESLDAAYARYEELGFELAAKAETATGVEFAFIDTVATLGHMVEIYEGSDTVRGFYDFVRTAAHGWTGDDPVRTLG